VSKAPHCFVGVALWLLSLANLKAEAPAWKEILVPISVSTLVVKESTPYGDGWVPTKKAYESGVSWVAIFIGLPESEWSGLATESELKIGRKIVTEWNLEWAPKGKQAWVVCAYHHTQAEMSLPVPKGAKRVRVTCDSSNVVNGHPNLLRVEYQ
jgi:hypothetical protein